MGFFDRLFGKKPQNEAVPMKAPQEEQKPAPVENAQEEKAPEAVPAVAPVAEAEAAAPAEAAVATEEETAISAEALQRKLDRYFARLREIYPDGVIVRLNTGHKKLAERGAQLRRLTGDEGDLDAFFARGGFTYQRSGGGRPALALGDVADIEARVRALFPDGAPTAMALRDLDHRLYLDLRALARREDVTVSAWLTAHGLVKSANA
ncbi:MAG: hypothetical protein IJC17_00465 [Clostridia bacterium]|nr:hypothetical protein [Clostridia bacterium]